MSHANAALTPRARLRLARLIVEDGWSPQVAAKMFMVSPVTARKWAARLRLEGPAGMTDRSSRPRSMPTPTPGNPGPRRAAKRSSVCAARSRAPGTCSSPRRPAGPRERTGTAPAGSSRAGAPGPRDEPDEPSPTWLHSPFQIACNQGRTPEPHRFLMAPRHPGGHSASGTLSCAQADTHTCDGHPRGGPAPFPRGSGQWAEAARRRSRPRSLAN
mgnify:CR=1 FL=1